MPSAPRTAKEHDIFQKKSKAFEKESASHPASSIPAGCEACKRARDLSEEEQGPLRRRVLRTLPPPSERGAKHSLKFKVTKTSKTLGRQAAHLTQRLRAPHQHCPAPREPPAAEAPRRVAPRLPQRGGHKTGRLQERGAAPSQITRTPLEDREQLKLGEGDEEAREEGEKDKKGEKERERERKKERKRKKKKKKKKKKKEKEKKKRKGRKGRKKKKRKKKKTSRVVLLCQRVSSILRQHVCSLAHKTTTHYNMLLLLLSGPTTPS